MLQEFDGHVPRLHPTAWVHEGAWLIGDVELGEEVTIWPGAVLRGDMGPIRIGAQSNVQDGAICHDTTDHSETLVGERVTIGHRAVLHGCIVEDECLIGMGAIIMDNARIGAGSLVGAGAVVPPGKLIPPGSVVLGTPGRVVRAVGEVERAMIEEGWRTYAEMAHRWRARVPAAR